MKHYLVVVKCSQSVFYFHIIAIIINSKKYDTLMYFVGLRTPEKFFEHIFNRGTTHSPIPRQRFADVERLEELLELVQGGHFLQNEDISAFDAHFFGISAIDSEALGSYLD